MEQRMATTQEYHQCVNRVVEYINNHLGEEIDLERLAEISHFSPYHFHRIMKAFLGEPLGAFIVRTRIETAARLLRYSTMPVSDIAYQMDMLLLRRCRKSLNNFMVFHPMNIETIKTTLL